ncbi:hypothetical protein HZC33_00355 [Candidatus Wolfebacteria bacterium]|nr:hypothetical protein [Candidatus Wolfebacteria bacterium]
MAAAHKLKNFFSEKIDKLRKKIVSFLRYQKPIAGLAITLNSIDVVIFDEKKGGMFSEKIAIKSLSVESVEEGLKKLKDKFGKSLSSVVISVPPFWSYISVFEFPLLAENDQIEEAMELASSALPIPEEKIYSDWMFLENKNIKKRETILEMTPSELIGPYLAVFEKNKISVIAAENYAWSFGQFLAEGDDTTMVVMEQPGMITFSIYDGRIPYFYFNLPRDKFDNNKEFLSAALHYLKSLTHFVLADDSKARQVNSIIVIGADELVNNFKSVVEIKIQKGFSLTSDLQNINDLGFLSALGAVKRGFIPRKKDDIVSLLPIGTELAYERHRMLSFIDFVQKFSIGFAGFLIVIFLSALLMIKALSSGIEQSLAKETALPTDVAEIKGKAVIFNENVLKLSLINNSAIFWEKIFIEIDKIVSATGVVLNQLSADESGNLIFSGNAPTRDSLIELKDRLAGSSVFSAESLPLSLFLSKENINFSVKAKLKDANFLYQIK